MFAFAWMEVQVFLVCVFIKKEKTNIKFWDLGESMGCSVSRAIRSLTFELLQFSTFTE